MAKFWEFDASEFLDNPDVFLAAVGNVAKARGMSAIAEQTGLGGESLYKAMAPGAKPRYDTVLKVLTVWASKSL